VLKIRYLKELKTRIKYKRIPTVCVCQVIDHLMYTEIKAFKLLVLLCCWLEDRKANFCSNNSLFTVVVHHISHSDAPSSTTFKLLQFSSPQYLRDTIVIQPSRSTRSSDLVTVLRPPVQSRLRITNRSFRRAAPQLWNKLPHFLRIPYQSGSSLSSSLSSGSNLEPAVNLSHGMFHSQLKTYLFSKSFPP